MLHIIFFINQNKNFTCMDYLRSILNQSLGLIIEVGFILLVVVALSVISKQIIQHIYSQSKKLQHAILREDFSSKILRPIRVMIWLIGLSYIVYMLVVRLQLQNNFEASFHQFRNLIVIIGSTWLCFEIKKQLTYSWTKKMQYSGKSPDHSKIDLVSKLISITLFVISALIVLDTLGVHIGALLALGGVGGVTLGFAAKDVFANLFSGFMLHITKPFEIGDWIHSFDTKNPKMEGTVEHIGFYLTRIRGFDKRPFYVPNSLFSSQITVNASRMSNRRIKQSIGIRYDDFNVIGQIIEDIRVHLKNNPHIDDNLVQLVDFVEYGPSSLNILVYTFTKTVKWSEWLQIQQDVLIEIGRIIEHHGAEIAYPTSTLHISGQSSK